MWIGKWERRKFNYTDEEISRNSERWNNNDRLKFDFLRSIYKDDRYYYWYEYSWFKHRGVHRYNNKENLFKDVLSKYAKVCDCDVKDIKLYVYDKPRYGINYSKFIRHVLAGSENLNK